MRITVLGGSGFIGSHVADELSKKGHKVTIFDKKKSKWIRSDQKMFIGNILNPNDLENVIKNTDVVFHFAALADIDQAIKNPINTVKVNILGTVQVLELCRKHNVKRFIHASTIYVNSVDGGFYRSSKKAAEDYVEEYKKIHSNIAEKILSTEEVRWTTIPMAENLIDNIRNEKDISDEKLNYMNKVDEYIQQIRVFYEKAS